MVPESGGVGFGSERTAGKRRTKVKRAVQARRGWGVALALQTVCLVAAMEGGGIRWQSGCACRPVLRGGEDEKGRAKVACWWR